MSSPPDSGLTRPPRVTAPRAVQRVLVFAPGPLGERMAGPEIRAWELAKSLSLHFRVSVAAYGGRAHERDGIRVVPATRGRVLREALRHDAFLAGCVPPYLLVLGALRGLVTVADQYDPHELELATLEAGTTRRRAMRTRRAVRELQLRYADVVLCAARAQREELLRVAAALPGAPEVDPIVLPFGIPQPPPARDRHPLRDRFPQLSPTDTVVLWWGSVWRWLDAELAVRAFARLLGHREDLKLVISAGPPSGNDGARFDAAADARALAAELGVLDRTVLFLDEWVVFEERFDYLRDADLGLTLHRDAREAGLAARARYMDYLAAGLPCVLSAGDETAEEFAAAGFATLLDSPDPELLANTLVSLADDRDALARAREHGLRLAETRGWSAVGERLGAALKRARPPGVKT
ncbi:MAG: glycosyltransferase family protein, partial [Solirubrobacteraceae bacterium]